MLHKAQRIRLSKAVVSLNLRKQKVRQPGQVYVALSRITNFERIYLTCSYSRTLIKTNVAGKDEYERLKLHQPYGPSLAKYSEKHSFIISLLSTRSGNKYVIDIAYTGTLLSSDITCLIETQLVPNHNIVNIENALRGFL